ncbi:hypothetical protein EB796_018470 [Bugula neritina]|uniref:Uncharacterized protein n=1 Tax=Bugula neritina TaxID=10212 RepID=A0A7J7JAG1_BUGNE|nr:hypothetical protein EB796_018470 [Bugula neritina]
MSDYAITMSISESANINYQQKPLDNGFRDAPCFVCGSVGLNGHQSLTESLYNLLVETRTVISSDKTNSICSTCLVLSELMEQAVQAQMSLAGRNRKKLGMTKNWKNINLITTHLFKAGSAVNMSGNVHQAQTDVDNENDEENLNLLISNIQGGLGQTDQGELKQTDLSQVDQPDIDNEFSIISEYNSPQQQVEIPRLECEIFEHEEQPMAETTTTSTEDNDHIIKEEMTISFEEQEYHIIWQTEAVGVNGDEKEDTLLYHSLREVEYERELQSTCRAGGDIQNEKARHSDEEGANSNVTDLEDGLKNLESYDFLREALKNVVVPIYHKNDGKRNYCKASYCYYCERTFTSKIIKHYLKCHIDQVAVRNMVQLEGRIAKAHRDRLINLGNYKYNTKVIQAGYGELIVVRMPDTYKHAADYLPCYLCLGFYSRDTLYRHIRGCSCQSDDRPNNRGAVGEGVSLINHMLLTPTINSEVSTLINGMTEPLQNLGTDKLHPVSGTNDDCGEEKYTVNSPKIATRKISKRSSKAKYTSLSINESIYLNRDQQNQHFEQQLMN